MKAVDIQDTFGAAQYKEMQTVLDRVVGCCVYGKIKCNAATLNSRFTVWADPVDHLILLQSSMGYL